ncbi:MAG TPA: WYL domain-containing protein, partial [Candidatus Solibacter sp.]|nr:WYL domain-containing protein [Candidatus Solibacter sp.]
LVTVLAPIESVAERVPAAVGILEAIDQRTCLLRTGACSLDALAVHLALLGFDFEVREPPELAARIRELAERFSRAAK